MNDEKRPDANETSTKAVMPGEVAALTETGNKAGETGQHQSLKKEIDEATDLPQKGSA
jgi:hypothetical protein